MNKTKDQVALDWYEYINHEYYAFRGDTRKTISDFAEWFDLPQGQLSQYMKKGGMVPKGLTVINKFVKRLGFKIYEVLDVPIPETPIDFLPEPLRSISREVRETLAEYTASGKTPDTGKIMDEIMKKYGYSNSTEIRDEP